VSRDTPIKPLMDNRNFLAITLSNKMRVLLVSDSDTTKQNGIIVSVRSGALADPLGVGGLAHLLGNNN